MCVIKKSVYVIISVLSVVNSARILGIYPAPFHSHQEVFRVLTEELSRQGHELVVITPLPYETALANVTVIDVHNSEDKSKKRKRNKKIILTIPPLEYVQNFVHPKTLEQLDAQFSTKEMRHFLRSEDRKFDIILAEEATPLCLMVAAKFKAPIILVSSFLGMEESYLLTGTAIHPLIFPEYRLQRTYNFSFWEKLTAIYTYVNLRILNYKFQDLENRLIKKHFGDDAPTISELRKNVQMVFLNVHPIWDNNRPVPPSVVYMGGLHLRKQKPIPEDLKKYLDSSKNGVIYFSLGSRNKISDLPPVLLNVFFKTFESLPFDVLVKWDGDEISKKPANVRLENWLPQSDLLHHPKVKAFITQGGLQSTDEAIAAKVPLIAFPSNGDQWYNAQKYVQLGIGVELDINNLNEQDLYRAILAVSENESYRDNMARLSEIMEEHRAGGIEKAVYWIDHVARHGGFHLRSPLADASLVDYLMLDILGAVAFLILIILSLIVILGKKIINLVTNSFGSLNRKLKSS